MSIQLQIFMICLIILQLVMIIRTIKTKRLSVKFGTLWIILFSLLMIPSIFPYPFIEFAKLIGFEAPSNLFMILAFFFVVYLIFILFMNVSIVEEKNKKIIQELALLKEKIEKEEQKNSQ